ncbi:MAG: O-antigen ligase family protein [Thiotrichales bacterium]
MFATSPLTAQQHIGRHLPAMLTVLMVSAAFAIIEPSPFDILSLLVFGALVLVGLRLPRQLELSFLLAVLFLMANLMSFVEVSDFAKAARYTAISAYMFILWLLFTSLFYQDAEAMQRMFWRGYLIAALLSALIGIAAFLHLLPNADLFLKHGRAKGLFKDPNVYGPFLVPAILWCGLRLFASNGAKQLGYILMLGILLVGLLLGFSRAAWGNLIMATFILLITRLVLSRSLHLLVSYVISGGVILGVLIISMTALLQLPEVSQMMEKRATLVQPYDVGETGRFGIQKRALLLGLEKPLGIGSGEVRDEFARYPHNVYVLTLVENGWLGMVSFAGFLLLQLAIGFHYLRDITRRSVSDPVDETIIVVFAVLLTTIMQSLFIDTLHWRHLFFLLGVMTGSIYWSRNRKA